VGLAARQDARGARGAGGRAPSAAGAAAERFAEVGWVLLVPLTLLQVLVTSLIVLAEAP
jgi:hypothetical protein